MKKIDDNQLRVINYLIEHGSATYKDIMPLIDWSESCVDAYLAVMAKLSKARIVEPIRKNDNITWRITDYGRYNFG